MPKIRPVSGLQKYSELLKEVSDGEPIFLTRNGRGKYVLMDIAEYERMQGAMQLLNGALAGSREAAESQKDNMQAGDLREVCPCEGAMNLGA